MVYKKNKSNITDVTIFIALSSPSVSSNFKQVIKIQVRVHKWYNRNHLSLPEQEQHLLSQYDHHHLNTHILM